jgi:hypothetical protein
VKTVGEDGNRTGTVAESNLGERHYEVEDEDAPEDASDGGVAINGHWSRLSVLQNAEFKMQKGSYVTNGVWLHAFTPSVQTHDEFAFSILNFELHPRASVRRRERAE